MLEQKNYCSFTNCCQILGHIYVQIGDNFWPKNNFKVFGHDSEGSFYADFASICYFSVGQKLMFLEHNTFLVENDTFRL